MWLCDHCYSRHVIFGSSVLQLYRTLYSVQLAFLALCCTWQLKLHVCKVCRNVWCAGEVVESPTDGYVSSRGPSPLDKFYESSRGSSYDRSTVKAYVPSRTSTQTTQELLYVTLGVVLGSSLLTLIVVMFVCSWRHRQRQLILGSYSMSPSLVAFSRHIL